MRHERRTRARRDFPPDGKLRVYRSRTGGNEWEALAKGLPQRDCYVNVLRDAMAPLPDAVVARAEPFLVAGAMAGG